MTLLIAYTSFSYCNFLEWELVMNTNVSKEANPTYSLNSSIENCGNKNFSQYLNSETNFQLMTSPLECAKTCKSQASMFLFGTNDTDISRCNEQGCICSCGQNISLGMECNQTTGHGFRAYRFLQEKRGKNQKAFQIFFNIKCFSYHLKKRFLFPRGIYTDFYKTRPGGKCPLGAIITKDDECKLAAPDVGLTYNSSCPDCSSNNVPFGCFFAPGNKYAWFNEHKDISSTKPMNSGLGSLCETEGTHKSCEPYAIYSKYKSLYA